MADLLGQIGLGVASWAVTTTLDQVIAYVVEANKYLDHCQDLQDLLSTVKPMVLEAIQILDARSATASSATTYLMPAPTGAVNKWLRDLEPVLKKAEDVLMQALAWVAESNALRRTLNIRKKKKWSGKIQEITEQIRKVGRDGQGYANLALSLHMQNMIREGFEDVTMIIRRSHVFHQLDRTPDVQGGQAEDLLIRVVQSELVKVGGNPDIVSERMECLEAEIRKAVQQIRREKQASQKPDTDQLEAELNLIEKRRLKQEKVELEEEFQRHKEPAEQETVSLIEIQRLAEEDNLSLVEYEKLQKVQARGAVETDGELIRTPDTNAASTIDSSEGLRRGVRIVQYTVQDIRVMTLNFADKLGAGGSSSVYRGFTGGRTVAVKVLDEVKIPLVSNFLREIEIMGLCRHANILDLYGYCIGRKTPKRNGWFKKWVKSRWAHSSQAGPSDQLAGSSETWDDSSNTLQALAHDLAGTGRSGSDIISNWHVSEADELMIVLEYASNGTLHELLYDGDGGRPTLSWAQRYNIIVGIAQGLGYLHERDRPIVHRDIKPLNILLDHNMCPKIGDFGLSLFMDDLEDDTLVVGTLGYLDPDYWTTSRPTLKSDVYSFGATVLSIVSGRKAFESVPMLHLVPFTLDAVERGERILDLKLGNNFSEEEVSRVVQVAVLCVRSNPDERPTMSQSLSMLLGHTLRRTPRLQSDSDSLYHERIPSEYSEIFYPATPESAANSMNSVASDAQAKVDTEAELTPWDQPEANNPTQQQQQQPPHSTHEHDAFAGPASEPQADWAEPRIPLPPHSQAELTPDSPESDTPTQHPSPGSTHEPATHVEEIQAAAGRLFGLLGIAFLAFFWSLFVKIP